MRSPTAQATITVALIGNPNTGKSTLFNALAGVHQRVGNYPGVTIEKKIGHADFEGRRFALIDLPGTYSLAPRSPDEMVAVDVLLGRRSEVERPDAVLCIVDASNLERNLYLVSQVLELGLPTVVALNMTDIARDRGIELDIERLRSQLGVPVVEIQANRRHGLAELKQTLVECLEAKVVQRQSPFPDVFQREVDALHESLTLASNSNGSTRLPRYLVERLLLDTGGYLEQDGLTGGKGELKESLAAARRRLVEAGHSVPAIEAITRYNWVARVLDGVVRRSGTTVSATDRLDQILTNKIWGTLVLAMLLLGVFTAIFVAASYPMDWIDQGIGWLGEQVGALMPEGALRSLVVDGVIGGVGAVVIFLPQIMILFGFIAILEDCGYMARAAYLMDKLMVRVGLSGKSFLPLLSSFACAIPGIMATRVIENRRDRLTTILVAPLMSCSARLPVYTVLIWAFIPTTTVVGAFLPGLTLFGMYLIGIVTAVVMALVFKKTLLRGQTPPFVMELPSYKWPSPGMVLHRMMDRGWAFIRRAGTLIFAVAIVVWALLYYPHNEAAIEQEIQRQQLALQQELAALPPESIERGKIRKQLAEFENTEELDRKLASIQQRQSFLGQAGKLIEPVVRPIGWDWRIGTAVLASFPAREVVLGVLGVMYQLGDDVDVDDEGDRQRFADRLQAATWDDTGERVYNVPVALSIMVFFALCAQCAATLAVIKRETNSWRWPLFAFVYMTGLAYLAAFLTYRVGMLFVS